MREPLSIPTRAETIRAHRASGGSVAAVFPIHYPRALLRAFGLLPVEVWGPPGRSSAAGDVHLQAYVCGIVRCGLSLALDGGLREAACLLVPHACDSLQGLGSLLLDLARPSQPVIPLYLPRGSREPDAAYLAAEIRTAYDRLAELTRRRPDDGVLLRAVEREERADAALAELLGARTRLDLTNREFYALVRSREYLPAEAFEPLARQALARVGDGLGGLPLLVSGIVPEPVAVLDALDRVGASLVADDLACSGRRLYRAGVGRDPFDRMAQNLLSAPPDPTRGCAVAEREARLRELARHTGAVGALFWGVKFCEPEQFYLPLARQALEAAGLKCLALEVDLSDPLPAAATTRIEAFVETLS